jgi:hypothetical protein
MLLHPDRLLRSRRLKEDSSVGKVILLIINSIKILDRRFSTVFKTFYFLIS